MKRITALFLMLGFLMGSAANAAEDRGEEWKKKENNPAKPEAQVPAASERQAPAARTVRPARVRKPKAVQPNSSNVPANQSQGQRPALGRTQRERPNQPSRVAAPRPAAQAPVVHQPNQARAQALVNRPAAQENARKNLSRMGLKAAPKQIAKRSEIVATDRAHSTIHYPRTGIRGETLRASVVSPRKFNSLVVRNQMVFVNRPSYERQIERERSSEIRRNYTYWHEGRDFNYAHYIDNGGYHWYGWYRDNQYFWTRYYNGRWWWYDEGYDRWCFYHDNYWWWQDPYNESDLYYYNDDDYVSLNLSVD